MSIELERVAIVGATGPTGRHLAAELLRRGISVRTISRSMPNLERSYANVDVELKVADTLDADALPRAIENCDLVVDCIGLPVDRMSDHERTAKIVADSARQAAARCLQVSSFWAFLPLRTSPLNEEHPRIDGNGYVRARRAAEDVMLEAGAAVVHLPDFFGPYVHASSLQLALEEAVAGKPMNWIGSAGSEREYAYVPDAMRTVAALATREETYGNAWIVPGSGPLSGRRAAHISSERLARDVDPENERGPSAPQPQSAPGRSALKA